MGCPCELRFYTQDKGLAQQVIERCVAEAVRFEHKYSRYRADSVTSKINRSAGKTAVRVDSETLAVLRYAGVCHAQSDGLFDITSGVFRHIWNQQLEGLPAESEIQKMLDLVGWPQVELDDNSVFLPKAGMELDFGGVIKEYAADALAALAKSISIEHGLVNLGGDICIIGPQVDQRAWSIGITHPTENHGAIASIELGSGAITTSGGYERYIEIDGKRYSHLINPKTGWPVSNLLSVTVTAAQAIVSGSICTIALLKEESVGLSWLSDCGSPYLAVDAGLNCHGYLTADKRS